MFEFILKSNMVLINLIQNAIHALENEKNASLILSAKAMSIGKMVEIRLTDNGTGMTDEVQNKIFEPLNV